MTVSVIAYVGSWGRVARGDYDPYQVSQDSLDFGINIILSPWSW